MSSNFVFNLFSSFDFSLFYVSSFLFPLGLALFFSVTTSFSSFSLIFSVLHESLSKFFHSLNKFYFSEFSFNLSWSFLLLFLYINFLSVFSFVFPLGALTSFLMFFSLSVWGSLFLMSFFKNLKGLLSHFIPEGGHLLLSFFLFLIEIVSMIIRPLTLGVRMCANILAGHLLMILLSLMVLKMPVFGFLYVSLNLVEMFVALIQSYIFVTLMILYVSEVK